MDSNHHRSRRRRRHYHRGASLIFPNVERNRRGRKSPFNDRCSGIVNSLRSAAVHRGRFHRVDSQLRVERIRVLLLPLWHPRRNANVSRRKTRSGSFTARGCNRDATEHRATTTIHTPPRSTNTRARVHACGTGLNCLRRLVIEWLTAGLCRAASVTREQRNREESNARGAAPVYASFHPSVLMRIANVFAVCQSTRGYNVTDHPV